MLPPLLLWLGFVSSLQPCKKMRQLAKERGVQLVLPVDVVVARRLSDDEGCCTVPVTLGCCTQECPCVPKGEPHASACWAMSQAIFVFRLQCS